MRREAFALLRRAEGQRVHTGFLRESRSCAERLAHLRDTAVRTDTHANGHADPGNANTNADAWNTNTNTEYNTYANPGNAHAHANRSAYAYAKAAAHAVPSSVIGIG